MDAQTETETAETVAEAAAVSSAQNGDSNSSTKKPRQKVTLLKALPSDRLSFDKQIVALRAYMIAYEHSGKPVTNVEAGKIVDMSENTIVVTNAFFTDAGFLIRVEGGFIPGDETRQFVKAEEWNKEAAPEKLRPLLERQWFCQLIIPRLRMRPLSKEEILHLLAESAGASAKERERVECLVEYICFAKVIKREGDSYRLVQAADAATPPPTPPAHQPEEKREEGLEEHAITLGPKRKFIIKSPPTLTESELERVKNWLSYQVQVIPDKKPDGGQ